MIQNRTEMDRQYCSDIAHVALGRVLGKLVDGHGVGVAFGAAGWI